jgi:hypothetical protein
MPTVIVHLMGQDPLMAEIDELPASTDQMVTLLNPRRRDSKPLHYVETQTVSVIFPMHRITFIEVRPDQEAAEDVDLFFRA